MGIFSSLLGGGGMMVPQPADSQMATAGMPYMGQPQPQSVKQKRPFAESTFGGILGMLGDALLAANGRAPMYAPRMAQMQEMKRQQQTGEYLANYLGHLDPGLADLVRNDPSAGLEVYKMMHPGAKEQPSFVQEYEYRQKLDPTARSDFDNFASARKFNPYAAPVVMGEGDTIETPGSQGDVTATGPNGEKIRLNPSTGQWEPVGGPTASPSAAFP